jgi:hypothetical protein
MDLSRSGNFERTRRQPFRAVRNVRLSLVTKKDITRIVIKS